MGSANVIRDAVKTLREAPEAKAVGTAALEEATSLSQRVADLLAKTPARHAEIPPSNGREPWMLRMGRVDRETEFPIEGPSDSYIRFRTDGTALLRPVRDSSKQYGLFDNRFFTVNKFDEPERISHSVERGLILNVGNPGEFRALYLVQNGVHDWRDLSDAARSAAREFIPNGSVPLNFGSVRQAWLVESGETVVLGPKITRPDCEFCLPATRTETIGIRQFEWFPTGDSTKITGEELNGFIHKVRLGGWKTQDDTIPNHVKLSNGSIWRVDPEEVTRMTPQELAEYRAKHR
jgi:hypothetical protein